MKTSTILTSLLAQLTAAISPPESSHPLTAATCTYKTYTVHGSAENRNLRGNPREIIGSFENFTTFAGQDNGSITINGTYNLRGQYCTPTKQHPKHEKPLILFVPGASYPSSYFSGLQDAVVAPEGELEPYSWMSYAAQQGYHVLSIDRLGNGESDRPDPLLAVQTNLQVSVLTSLLHHLSETHSPLIGIGHSYGSQILTQISTTHPSLLPTLILTGLSTPVSNPLPAQWTTNFTVASDFAPTRFPSSQIADGYMLMTNATARANLFFAEPDTHSAAIVQRDFDTQGTFALGEAASQGTVLAENYEGAVFVLLGERDVIFCGDGTRGSGICGVNDGENRASLFARENFPKASVRGDWVQRDSGHDLMLHYSWEEGVRKAHEWLEELSGL